ncbi:MAG TPA: hypothetical protein PLO37_00440 [Candidatus Hydrogenedentes bacterium]|nr:hypothetical protein [Candidatus Hydrogenedentota bacterium]HPG65281.1 hypothetical protein [Candidatus Hydrogenedentota bacterium]
MRRFPIALGVGLVMSFQAWAWGPATHAYLAMKITGQKSPDIIYGAMAPDMSMGALFDQDLSNRLANLTHGKFELLAPSAFATGFATHNGLWGADSYAHTHHSSDDTEAYATRKVHQLMDELNISHMDAEGYFEGAVDLLVRFEYGPELSRIILESASGSSHADDMAAAFAKPLAEASQGMSEEAAAEAIRKAVAVFQFGAQYYGRQTMQPDENLRKVAIMTIRMRKACDMATAEKCFERALEICRGDYVQELDRIAGTIRVKMKQDPRYALP